MKKIRLNKIYFLDVGGLIPIKVRAKKFMKDGVRCKYSNSFANRFEEIGYDIFEMNGYEK